MKKTIIISAIGVIFFFIGVITASAQSVAINSTGATGNASAMLDVDAANKGLLIPRVSLTDITDVTTIPSPATSLLVYNTNATMTGGGLGYWYWDGAKWVQLLSSAPSTVNVSSLVGSSSVSSYLYTYTGTGTPLFLVVSLTTNGSGNTSGRVSVQWEDAASGIIRPYTRISGTNVNGGPDGGSGMLDQELATIPFLPGSVQLRFSSVSSGNTSFTIDLISVIDK